jgi:hypothetical protein
MYGQLERIVVKSQAWLGFKIIFPECGRQAFAEMFGRCLANWYCTRIRVHPSMTGVTTCYNVLSEYLRRSGLGDLVNL